MLRTIKHLLIIFIASFSLAGCGLVYHMDVQQGNYIEPSKVKKIRAGMRPAQVQRLMGGRPILVNIYNGGRMIYVYTFQPGHGDFHQTAVTIYFRNGRVRRYTSDIYEPPTIPKPAKAPIPKPQSYAARESVQATHEVPALPKPVSSGISLPFPSP